MAPAGQMKECRIEALPYWFSFWNPKLHPSISVSRQWFFPRAKTAPLDWALVVVGPVEKVSELIVTFKKTSCNEPSLVGEALASQWCSVGIWVPKTDLHTSRPPAAPGWIYLLWILTLPSKRCRKKVDLSDEATFSSPLLSSSIWTPVSIRQEGYLIYCCLPVMQN